MSSVDNRIVKMQFDNAQFESGVSQSMSTLDKLNEKLQFKGADKNLRELQNSVNSVDFNRMTAALDKIGDRFSAIGIAGMEVVRKITDDTLNSIKRIGDATIGQIKNGGWSRAMNLANAQFTIEGLKLDWQKLEKAISYGVKDTAYGLDAAAKAASSLAASGVKFEESVAGANDSMMHKTLRAISGVAAMTNSSYEDISRIFTTVAGNGRLMGDQLLQLSSRGLNVAAVLSKQLKKSESDVRDMVSKGSISFDMFAKAMDDAFGAHAKEANKTFTGALSNMKASLSRIGAIFATPVIEKTNKLFIAITEKFDAVKAGMSDTVRDGKKVLGFQSHFAQAWDAVLDVVIKLVKHIDTDFLKSIGTRLDKVAIKIRDIFVRIGSFIDNYSAIAKNGYSRVAFIFQALRVIISNFINTLKYVKTAVGIVLKSIFIAFARVFNLGGVTEIIVKLSSSVMSLGEKMVYVATKASPYIIKAFEGIFTVGQFVYNIVGNIAIKLIDFVSSWKSGNKEMSKTTDNAKKSGSVLESLAKILDKFLDGLKKLPETLTKLWTKLGESKGVKRLGTALTELGKTLFEVFGDGLNPFAKKLNEVANNKKSGDRIQTIVDIIDMLANTLAAVIELLPSWIRAIANFGAEVTKVVKNIYSKIKDFISGLFDSDAASTAGERFKNTISNIFSLDKQDSIVSKLFKFGQGIIGALTDGLDSVSWEKVARIGIVVIVVKKLLELSSMISKVSRLPGTLLGVFESIKNTFTNMGRTFKYLSIANVVGTILSSFAAILGIVWLLTKVPSDKLESAVESVFAIMVAIVILMKATSKLAESISKTRLLDKISVRLLSAIHIYILIGGAIVLLGGIIAGLIIAVRAIPNDSNIYEKVNSIGLMLLYIGGFILIANALLKKIKLSSGFIRLLVLVVVTAAAMAKSVSLLSDALKKVPARPEATLTQLSSMCEILVAIGIFMVVVKAVSIIADRLPGSGFYSILIKTLISAGVLAASLKLLTPQLMRLPANSDSLTKRFGSFALILASLAGFMLVIEAVGLISKKLPSSNYYTILFKTLISSVVLARSISMISGAFASIPPKSEFDAKFTSAIKILELFAGWYAAMGVLFKIVDANIIDSGLLFVSFMIWEFADEIETISEAIASLPSDSRGLSNKLKGLAGVTTAIILFVATFTIAAKILHGVEGYVKLAISLSIFILALSKAVASIIDSLNSMSNTRGLSVENIIALGTIMLYLGISIAAIIAAIDKTNLGSSGKGVASKMIAMAVVILAIGKSMQVITLSLNSIPDPSADTWTRVGIIGGIMLALAGMIGILSKAASTMSIGSIIGVAALLILVVSSLVLIVSQIIVLSAAITAANLVGEANSVIVASGLVGAILMAIAGAVILMSRYTKDAGKVGSLVGIVLSFAAVIVVIGIVIEKLANIKDGLLEAAGAIAIITGVLLIGLIGMIAALSKSKLGSETKLEKIALAILLMSGALLVIAMALDRVSKISTKNLVKAGIALGVALLALIGLAALAGHFKAIQDGLTAIAALILSVGISAALLGVGMLAMATSIKIATPLLPFFAIGLGKIFDVIAEHPVILAALVAMFVAFAVAIKKVVDLALPLIKSLGAGLTSFIKLIGSWLQKGGQAIGNWFENLTIKGKMLFAAVIISLCAAIEESGPKIFETFGKMLFAVIDWLTEIVGPLADKIVKFLAKLIDSIGQAITENSGRIAVAIWSVITSLIVLVVQLLEKGLNALFGWDLDWGDSVKDYFRENLNEMRKSIEEAGEDANLDDLQFKKRVSLGMQVGYAMYDNENHREAAHLAGNYWDATDLKSIGFEYDKRAHRWVATRNKAFHYLDEQGRNTAYSFDGSDEGVWREELEQLDRGMEIIRTLGEKRAEINAAMAKTTNEGYAASTEAGNETANKYTNAYNTATKNNTESMVKATKEQDDTVYSQRLSDHDDWYAAAQKLVENKDISLVIPAAAGGFGLTESQARELGFDGIQDVYKAFEEGADKGSKDSGFNLFDTFSKILPGNTNDDIDISNVMNYMNDAGSDGMKELFNAMINEQASDTQRLQIASAASVKSGVVDVIKDEAVKREVNTSFETGVVNPMVDAIRSSQDDLEKGMVYAMAGLMNGFLAVSPGFRDTWQRFVDGLPKYMEDKYKIESPSRLFSSIGENVVLGFTNGITSTEDAATGSMADLSDQIIKSFGNPLDIVRRVASGELQYDPSIRPVLDLTTVSAGAQSIDSMFANQNVSLSGISGQLAADIGEMQASNADIIAELQALRADMSEMSENMENLQVVMDSGVLVGAIAPGVDKALGMRNIYKGRGN